MATPRKATVARACTQASPAALPAEPTPSLVDAPAHSQVLPPDVQHTSRCAAKTTALAWERLYCFSLPGHDYMLVDLNAKTLTASELIAHSRVQGESQRVQATALRRRNRHAARNSGRSSRFSNVPAASAIAWRRPISRTRLSLQVL